MVASKAVWWVVQKGMMSVAQLGMTKVGQMVALMAHLSAVPSVHYLVGSTVVCWAHWWVD